MSKFTSTARRLGILSAACFVVLAGAYATILVIGLVQFDSPEQPIANPLFSILELLIIAMMPAPVALMVAVHAWTSAESRTLSLAALIFMSMVAALTTSIHFVVLTVSREPSFAGEAWLRPLLSFEWPSLAYALDILPWDFLFALSMFFAAPLFRGSPLAAAIRGLFVASGLLALAGLAGIATGDMTLRKVGIAGYLGTFPVGAALLALLFYRTPSVAATASLTRN